MTYEGQVAGVPDEVPRTGSAGRVSAGQDGLRRTAGRPSRARSPPRCTEVAELEFWNAGGSGSLESSAADPVVTEVAAGSGLLVPGLFDHYRSFRPCRRLLRRPRRPPSLRPTWPPSPAAAWSRRDPRAATGCRSPWAPPGLHLIGLEGAGEVQTPLGGPGARAAGRRPGVVPAREVRRAGRARARGASAARQRDRRDRPDLPRHRERLVSADTVAVGRRLGAVRPAHVGSWSTPVRGRPAGSGKTTWPAPSSSACATPAPPCRWCTWTTCTPAGPASSTG